MLEAECQSKCLQKKETSPCKCHKETKDRIE